MYENTFSELNSIKLNSILNEGYKHCSCLEMDNSSIAKQNELFELAEAWLNAKGITTRTEYNNLLPTYNLFLKIGEWLERRNMEENDE